jgi:hypothetical protein
VPAPRPLALVPPRAGFFLKVILRRLKKHQTALRLPAMHRLRIAITISSNVKFGLSATKASSHCACSSNGDLLPPLGFAAMLPVVHHRCIHLTPELALTSRLSAASRRDAPDSAASIKRTRRSWEHGFGIVRLHKRNDALRLAHPKSLGNPPIQLSRNVL